jgi:hypothetical protein
MGGLEHGGLPIVLEFLESLEHRKQPEIHGSHIQACNLRLPYRSRFYPLFDGHIGRAAGREIHDHIGLLLDGAQKWFKCLWRLVGPAVLRIAGMKMDDCGAGLGSAQSGFRDLRCRNRQMGRHRRRVDGPRDCARNNNLPWCHGEFLCKARSGQYTATASMRERSVDAAKIITDD